MGEAKLIRLPADCKFHDCGFKLVRKDQEIWDSGFEAGSLITRVVKGLKRGSRAEKAGVREGDRILKNRAMGLVECGMEWWEKLVVEREVGDWGVERKEIVYWPRGAEKVECWELEKAADGDEDGDDRKGDEEGGTVKKTWYTVIS